MPRLSSEVGAAEEKPCGDDDARRAVGSGAGSAQAPRLFFYNARRQSRSCLVAGACGGLLDIGRRRPLRLSAVRATLVVVDGGVGVALAEV